MKWFSLKVASLFFFGVLSIAIASDHPQVDADIATYDRTVAAMNAQFDQIPSDPLNKAWVIKKIQQMVDVDQYMRKYSDTPYDHHYTEVEKSQFWTEFMPRWNSLDQANTTEVQSLLKIYNWFTVSEFGAQTDGNGWLLVQHADLSPDFQKQVLAILEKLYLKGETNPQHYAYLFDRVAASYNDPTQSKPQRYGTQGACTGPGTWQPLPSEDPANLDARRASVGLGSEADYIKVFKDICH